MKRNLSVLYIGVGVLGVAVLGAAVVLLAEGRRPASYDLGTPQAAMQEYLTAWQSDDYEAAYAYFSDEIKGDTSLEEYETLQRNFGDPNGYQSNEAVYIDKAEGDDAQVTLYLTVEQFYGGDGLGGGSYRSPRSVRMVHQADGWKIDEPLMGVEQFPFEQPLEPAF
jgi:hypothetical protein